MSRFLSIFTAISLKTYSTDQMAAKRKASTKTLPSQARGNENPFGLLVECAPIKSIELESSLAALTVGWDWGEGISVNLNTSEGRLNLEFLSDEGTPVACILEGFTFYENCPAKSGGPEGIMMAESKKPEVCSNVQRGFGERLIKSGKLTKPLVMGSTAFQYAAFILRKVSNSAFRQPVVCFAVEIPQLKSPTDESPLWRFAFWLDQWWDKHVKGIVKKKDDERKQLMAECYNPEGIDPWENQCEVLRNLMAEDYPKLFAAWEMLKNAKTEHAREDARQKARLAFIAEWKAVTGTPPSWVDDRGFSQDDDFIELLFNATKKNPGSKSGADKWWLAINWTGKKLLIMKPKQLAECYFQETGQNVSGDTLARYSRDIGLKNMRKQGPTGVRNK